MRRPFTLSGGQRFRANARSILLGRRSIGLILVVGALLITPVMLRSPTARAFLDPRFGLVIASAILGFIVIGTISITLLTMLLVVIPTLQLGTVSAAGILFNPSLVLGAALSIGLIVRLSFERLSSRRAWTATGAISVWAVIAAMVAVVLSSIANGESLSNCVPWILAGGIALSLILSARFGYLKAGAIPVALLTGFAISATSDFKHFLMGTRVDTGVNAGRFVGGLGDYELLGEFYAVAIIIALATLVHVRRLAISLLALYVIGLGLVLVFATHSRSPIVLLAIACPLLLMAPFIGRNMSRPRATLIVVVAAVLGTALAPLISSADTVARLSTIVDNGDLVRSLNRSAVWPLVVTDPKFLSAGLFGNGPVGIYDWLGTYPHNLVLWTIWSLGIVGLVFVALLAATGISGIIHWRKHGWVTVLLGFSLIFLLADETVIEFPRKGSMILFVLALCALVGAASISERSETLGHSAE